VNTRKPVTAADLDNRSRLLHAATDAFAEYGYEGASLRAIADNAGVSFQLIAYYFGSKEELWIATVDFLFERYLETGKGLGFTSSGNLAEQFHNHLRLLLTDMLQRPQLRKVWIQEYLADSPRYHNVIRPKIKQLYDTLSVPYFKEVVRLGIVERFNAEEIAVLWSAVVQNNVVYPYYVELALGVPAGSPKSVEPPTLAELAVLRLLATDLSRREIGSELFLSMNTIKTHTRHLYGKLGVSSREEAVRQASMLGLLGSGESPG